MSALTAGELMALLRGVPRDSPVRVGDVAEKDDLHCSVGRVVYRGRTVVLAPGDDDVWQDETLASEVLSNQLWPKEDTSED